MKLIKCKDYTVSPMDAFLFDTNVWFLIYGPVAASEQRKQRAYSCLLQDAVNRGACIFITSLIVSEYINAVLRLGFKQWMRSTGNFNADYKRDFRPTQSYKICLQDAIDQIEDILKVAKRHPDDFNSIDFSKILDQMDENCDFNDSYYVTQCGRMPMKLVSDDADMQKIGGGITVITA